MGKYDQLGDSPPRDTSSPQGITRQVSFDDRTESVGMAVVSAVAARSDTDPVELDSLSTVVKPDALDALFQPGAVGEVSFVYNGYEVVVHSDGELDLTKNDE